MDTFCDEAVATTAKQSQLFKLKTIAAGGATLTIEAEANLLLCAYESISLNTSYLIDPF